MEGILWVGPILKQEGKTWYYIKGVEISNHMYIFLCLKLKCLQYLDRYESLV